MKSVRRYIEDVEFCLAGECIILHVPDLYRFRGVAKDEIQINSDRTNDISIDLVQRIVNELNNYKSSISDVLEKWTFLLQDENIHLKKIYFKHKNRLFEQLYLDQIELYLKNKYNNIFKDDMHKPNSIVQELLDAIICLSLGSMGHHTFQWKSIEARVGHILTDRDKWILRQMNFLTTDLHVNFITDDILKIELKREKIKQIYEIFGCQWRGDQNGNK